ncbi:hypothetical protein ACJJTC_006771 [Scirpophaga incertulas]
MRLSKVMSKTKAHPLTAVKDENGRLTETGKEALAVMLDVHFPGSKRRKTLDMGLLYDVVRGRLDCPELVEQVALRALVRRTRHTTLFSVPSHLTNYGCNAVLSRIAKSYNTEFSDIDPFIGNKKTFLNKIRDRLK